MKPAVEILLAIQDRSDLERGPSEVFADDVVRVPSAVVLVEVTEPLEDLSCGGLNFNDVFEDQHSSFYPW